MTIIACGQNDVIPDECPECGGWLHVERLDGFPGANGFRYCSEECIADSQERAATSAIVVHLHQRDLVCACEICTAHGLPTQAMHDEYAAYVASRQAGKP
jgi:hypothetical protein